MAAERSAQRETLLHAWTSPGLLEVLEVIADGIRDVAGFDTTAFSLLRGNELEFLTARSGGQMLYVFGGTFFAVENLQDEWMNGELLGRFVLVPEERRRLPAQWHSSPTLVTDPDQWRVIDLMFAPMFHEDGELMATIMIDSPVSGRRPNAEQIRHLDTFVSHCEQVLRRALEYDALTERVELIGRLHDVVRRADTQASPQDVFIQIAEEVREAFHASAISAQLCLDGPDPDDPPRIIHADGTTYPPDPEMWQLVVDASALALERRTVAVVSEGRIGSPFLTVDQHTQVLAAIKAQRMHSGVLVPVFVGNSFLGALFLMRTREQGRWTDEQISAAAEFGLDAGQAIMNAREFVRGIEVVDRLQEIDAYKTHLITQISHEFRSPLTSIHGHLELIEDNDGLLPPPSLAAMRRGTDRLIGLTEQLMTLSRTAEAGNADDFCDAIAITATAVARCADHAHEAGVQVDVAMVDHEVTIHGAAYDGELLAVNLIDNAIKYTDHGGVVRVTVDVEDDEAVLRVADNGIGIPEEDQERLFDEFFRSEQPEVMNRPGTGLGLSIVARIANRMHGRVEVDSELGVGTTFTVRLPIAAQ